MFSVDQARQRVAIELLALAKRDAAAMRILSQASEMDFSPIGFLAQQCLEKCLKGVMAKAGITYPRTHDLGELHQLLTTARHAVPMSLKLLDDFTPYAVTIHYDIDQEDLVDRAQAEAAVALMLAWAMTIINPK